MASRPQAKLGVKITDYNGILDLAQQVHDQMVLNVADFPAPVPTMANFQTDIDTMTAALAAWGPVGNRGSHAELVALRAATVVVYNDLLQLMTYVMNLVDLSLSYPDQTAFILSAGFPVKNSPSPQGVLEAVNGFRQMFQSSVSIYTPKLKWSKPNGLLSPNNVKSYQVLRQENIPAAPIDVIANVTKTSYIDTSAEGGKIYNYWVRGINTSGEGVLSDAVIVSVPF